MNISLEYEGKEYVLEYSKQAVRTMENQGFNIDLIGEKPTTMVPLLFKGAFIKNHKETKSRIVDAIYDIIDKDELIITLAEMYMETVNSVLAGNEGDEAKKIKWTKNE